MQLKFLASSKWQPNESQSESSMEAHTLCGLEFPTKGAKDDEGWNNQDIKSAN
jgi:hypothetical protein